MTLKDALASILKLFNRACNPYQHAQRLYIPAGANGLPKDTWTRLVMAVFLALKLFLIDIRGVLSHWLFHATKTATAFMTLLQCGPPGCVEPHVFVFISKPTSLLTQPALCVHFCLILNGNARPC